MTQAPANAIRLANEIGQSVWLDSISRELIRSGELARLFRLGVSGVTSNPTIFEKAVSEGASYDDALLVHAEAGGGAGAVFEELAVEDIRDTADLLQGVYESTASKDGYVSIEVNPLLARDTDGTVDEARRLFESIGAAECDDQGARHARRDASRQNSHRQRHQCERHAPVFSGRLHVGGAGVHQRSPRLRRRRRRRD